jgi:hypothetical protein
MQDNPRLNRPGDRIAGMVAMFAIVCFAIWLFTGTTSKGEQPRAKIDPPAVKVEPVKAEQPPDPGKAENRNEHGSRNTASGRSVTTGNIVNHGSGSITVVNGDVVTTQKVTVIQQSPPQTVETVIVERSDGRRVRIDTPAVNAECEDERIAHERRVKGWKARIGVK